MCYRYLKVDALILFGGLMSVGAYENDYLDELR